MKKSSTKIAEDFGKACYQNGVIALGITLNEKDNSNAIFANATGYEAGFMLRQLIKRLLEVYSDDDNELANFKAELSKLNLLSQN